MLLHVYIKKKKKKKKHLAYFPDTHTTPSKFQAKKSVYSDNLLNTHVHLAMYSLYAVPSFLNISTFWSCHNDFAFLAETPTQKPQE